MGEVKQLLKPVRISTRENEAISRPPSLRPRSCLVNAPLSPVAPIAFIDLLAQRRRLGERIDRAVMGAVDAGQWIMGPQVTEFERRLAAFGRAAHALACANGTDALALPLMAWKIGAGDAVFCPSFTFTATAEAVAWTGCDAGLRRHSARHLQPRSCRTGAGDRRDRGRRAAETGGRDRCGPVRPAGGLPGAGGGLRTPSAQAGGGLGAGGSAAPSTASTRSAGPT